MWWFDPDSAPGWFDWVSFSLGVIGFGGTVVGFVIAFKQLHKTRTATEAAAASLTEAQERLNSDQLGSVLPHISTVLADLDFAIVNNDREVAHRALLRFSYVASECVALLDNLAADYSALQARLATASENALDAKGTIVGTKTVDIARTAKHVANEIGLLSVEMSGITAKARYRLGEPGNV